MGGSGEGGRREGERDTERAREASGWFQSRRGGCNQSECKNPIAFFVCRTVSTTPHSTTTKVHSASLNATCYDHRDACPPTEVLVLGHPRECRAVARRVQ